MIHAADLGKICIALADDDLRRRIARNGRQLGGRQIGRAQRNPSRDAVERDQRQRRGQLIGNGKQDRASRDVAEPVSGN